MAQNGCHAFIAQDSDTPLLRDKPEPLTETGWLVSIPILGGLHHWTVALRLTRFCTLRDTTTTIQEDSHCVLNANLPV